MADPIVRVVVVDDEADVRTVVTGRLARNERFEVIGEGASGREAVELVQRLRPDLLLLDVSMPGSGGLEALQIVRETVPDTRVVMYSGLASAETVARARDL